jgi:hypothetical protein
MALIAGHNNTRGLERIANRTEQSGGSCGGVKKAGFGALPVYMKVYNIGTSYTYRIPSKQLSCRENHFFSTRSPTQIRRGSYTATHNGMLG